MAIKPKDIIGAAVGLGRAAGETVAGRLRGGEAQPPTTASSARRTPSGSPSTVGAPKAGEAGAPRSATSSARRKTAKSPDA